MNNFHYAMSLCQTLYGIDLKEDDFEEIALTGWNMIGNKRTRIYRFDACLNKCSNNSYSVELPCNADMIEAVTTNFEDWGYVDGVHPNGNLNSSNIEEYIERKKAFHDPLYASGKFLRYERVGDTLYFDKPYGNINILYRGIILDEEGLPELTDKEAIALATYCAYIIKFREGLMTNNNNIIQTANVLKQRWDVQCDQARVDGYFDQNTIDSILEAKNNWNRKVFNSSYKIYK